MHFFIFGLGCGQCLPYDITKIINNNDKYEESNYGLYLIEDSNGNEYDIYYTNMEMQEFLESLDIKFGCLVQQE